MNSQVAYLLRLVVKEMWSKPRLTIAIYILSSFAFLTAAWVWPRIYTSTSVVLIDSESILSPLMRGTAVTTEIVDEAKRARQIILNRTSIEKILELSVWQATDKFSEEGPEEKVVSNLQNENQKNLLALDVDIKPKNSDVTEIQILRDEDAELRFEILTKEIKASTTVTNVGRNIIEINYQANDPHVAFETVTLLTDIFVNESIYAKQIESRSAFNFIDNQVSIYQKQLTDAERAIKDFRSKNLELTPGARDNASTKLLELRTEVETAELEKSAEQAVISLRKRQLRGEQSESSSDIEKETLLSARISGLDARLNELLLSYKETYPDVVQLKSQISTLRKQLSGYIKEREQENSSNILQKPTASVAQEFRRQISLSENIINGLDARIEQLDLRADREKDILAKIIAVEADVSELTRDQAINQDMYNRLLSQRENARVSMNIDIQKQGLTMKVQEQASLPYLPKGLRFVHIILVGLVLSFLAPAFLVFVLAELDQKVRSNIFFKETFKVPVLATLHTLPSLTDSKENRRKMFMIILTIALVWGVYAGALYLKRFG